MRAYAQRDPLNEYKTEAFSLFANMLARFRESITLLLAHVELRPEPEPEEAPPEPALAAPAIGPADGFAPAGAAPAPRPAQRLGRQARPARDPRDPSTWGKVGRNDPCPCGTGKKYKHCHGAVR